MTTETNGIIHDIKDHGAREAALHGVARSNHWPSVRREHLKREPRCQWCGRYDFLEVHHRSPFHIHPELELELSNLITLCENDPDKTDCHYQRGHNGVSWKQFNATVREQCEIHQRKLHQRKLHDNTKKLKP